MLSDVGDGNRPGQIRFHAECGDHKLNVVHHEVNLDLLSRIESRETWVPRRSELDPEEMKVV